MGATRLTDIFYRHLPCLMVYNRCVCGNSTALLHIDFFSSVRVITAARRNMRKISDGRTIQGGRCEKGIVKHFGSIREESEGEIQ